jgi:hypothetical protein
MQECKNELKPFGTFPKSKKSIIPGKNYLFKVKVNFSMYFFILITRYNRVKPSATKNSMRGLESVQLSPKKISTKIKLLFVVWKTTNSPSNFNCKKSKNILSKFRIVLKIFTHKVKLREFFVIETTNCQT